MYIALVPRDNGLDTVVSMRWLVVDLCGIFHPSDEMNGERFADPHRKRVDPLNSHHLYPEV